MFVMSSSCVVTTSFCLDTKGLLHLSESKDTYHDTNHDTQNLIDEAIGMTDALSHVSTRMQVVICDGK